MYGAYKYEFYLFKTNSCIELSTYCIRYCATSLQKDKEEFAKRCQQNYAKKLEICIEPEVLHVELVPRQFEIINKSKLCLFHGQTNSERHSSSAHFNHSLWKGHVNLFHNNSNENKVSDIAKHWLAGLRYHVKPLVALNIPSNNCMERVVSGFSKVNGVSITVMLVTE